MSSISGSLTWCDDDDDLKFCRQGRGFTKDWITYLLPNRKGPFTSSESERINEKDQQAKEIKEKFQTSKKFFCFRFRSMWMGLKICTIKVLINRGQIRLVNDKTTDLDWYYSRHNQNLKFLIRDLLTYYLWRLHGNTWTVASSLSLRVNEALFYDASRIFNDRWYPILNSGTLRYFPLIKINE